MTDKLVFALDVSEREFNTILAALRHYQESVVDRYDPNEDDIATNGGSVEALGVDEIDTLCERINGSEEQESRYIIISKFDPTDYWSNDDGWTEFRDSATVFTEEERKTLQTPVDGLWVTLRDEDVVTCNCGESFTCSVDGDWNAWDNHAQNCDLHMPDLTD